MLASTVQQSESAICVHVVLVPQLCLTLCDPVDYRPLGSSVHGILQARILEWVAIPFSRGSSWPRDQTWVSHIAGRFFIIWATREAQYVYIYPLFFGFVSHRKHGCGCQSTASTSSPHLRAVNNVFCFERQADSTSKTATLLSILNLSPILYPD